MKIGLAFDGFLEKRCINMRLFELRACWEEEYNCPDKGLIKICDKYETIAFAVDEASLKAIVADLTSRFRGERPSDERSKELTRLYPNFYDHDNQSNAKYEIVEVTKLLLPIHHFFKWL